jgi:hypothetical protein
MEAFVKRKTLVIATPTAALLAHGACLFLPVKTRLAIDGTINGRHAGSVRYTLSADAGGTRFLREFTYSSPNLLFLVLNRFSIRRQIDAESAQAVFCFSSCLESDPN